MSFKPAHALLLPGGKRPRREGERPDPVDDYLERRRRFRRKPPRDQDDRSETAARRAGAEAGPEGTVVDALTSLRSLASPLEIALVACCEPASEVPGAASPRRRPAGLPSNAEATDHDEPAPEEQGQRARVLRAGQEGRFVKLMLCCSKEAVGHRALAVAVLQQTVDWEVEWKASHRRRVDQGNAAPAPDLPEGSIRGGVPRGNDEHGCSNAEVEREPPRQAQRTVRFLAGGGMKLLARWLVDAYTSVPSPAREPRKYGEIPSPRPVASPTACLLLPLMRLLKGVPFDHGLVVASQINKAIRNLKKQLSAERERPQAVGGATVNTVLAAVDAIMEEWERAVANAAAAPPVLPGCDPWLPLKEKIKQRFAELEQYQNDMGSAAPTWLPRSLLGMRKAMASPPVEEKRRPLPNPLPASSAAVKRNIGEMRTQVVDTREDTRTAPGRVWDRIVRESQRQPSKRPKLENGPPRRRVSWADQPPLRSGRRPRAIKEERYYVRDDVVTRELDASEGAQHEERDVATHVAGASEEAQRDEGEKRQAVGRDNTSKGRAQHYRGEACMTRDPGAAVKTDREYAGEGRALSHPENGHMAQDLGVALGTGKENVAGGDDESDMEDLF